MSLPSKILLWEAGARDGLQNEAQIVPTAVKAELIDRLVDAGLDHIEAGAFVSPKWVPQMADSAEVFAAVHRRPGAVYQALIPNIKGLEAAIASGFRHAAVFAAASETFSKRNINCTIDESLERFRPVMAEVARHGIEVRGFVSCVVDCPFEGPIAPAQTARVTKALIDMGCTDVALGDSIGTGTPTRVQAMIEACARDVPLDRLGVHFHDTYGQALANILASLEVGITSIDAAAAGLGGCPYAPGATGNVATEDVVYMLDGMGIETGVDLKALVRAAWFISDALGRPPASRVAKAMKAKL